MLYVQELQAMADHTKYQDLQSRYNAEKLAGVPDSQLGELIMGIQMYKTWWSKLTESIIKGLSKIADRERRSKDVESGAKIITIQGFNKLLKESKKYLEDNRP